MNVRIRKISEKKMFSHDSENLKLGGSISTSPNQTAAINDYNSSLKSLAITCPNGIDWFHS